MAVTKTTTASGDFRTDGLLGGLAWNNWVSYSVPNVKSDYGSFYGDSSALSGFYQISSEQRDALQRALDADPFGVLTAPPLSASRASPTYRSAMRVSAPGRA